MLETEKEFIAKIQEEAKTLIDQNSFAYFNYDKRYHLKGAFSSDQLRKFAILLDRLNARRFDT